MSSQHADHLSPERLQAFLEGELSRRERASAEKHLESCARCSAELDGWRVLFEDLDGLRSHRPLHGFAERVMSEVELPQPQPLAARVRDRVQAGLSADAEGHLDQETIQDLLEGAFGPRRTKRIEAHLAACASCSLEVDTWAVIFRDLDGLRSFAPANGFRERVMARVDASATLPLAARIRQRVARLAKGDTSAHLPEALLQDFVDGALTPRAVARVRAHVGECASCASEVHAWRRLHVDLRALERPEPSEGFGERVMAAYRIEQMLAAAAPVPQRSGLAVAIRRTLGRPRETMAALTGMAVTPLAIFGVAVWAVFSHPTVTMGSLLSFVAWQIADLVGLAGSAVGGTFTRAVTAIGGPSAVEVLSDSPLLLGAAVVGYMIVSVLALRVLYRNLVTDRPSEGRYAHARLAS